MQFKTSRVLQLTLEYYKEHPQLPFQICYGFLDDGIVWFQLTWILVCPIFAGLATVIP